MPFKSYSDKEKVLTKYESFIIGEPSVPAGEVPTFDLLDEIKIMAFRFSSAPGTVPERNYLANNSVQKRMSQHTRFMMAKHNFPAKVSYNLGNHVIFD